VPEGPAGAHPNYYYNYYTAYLGRQEYSTADPSPETDSRESMTKG